jgi:hypothetical protein
MGALSASIAVMETFGLVAAITVRMVYLTVASDLAYTDAIQATHPPHPSILLRQLYCCTRRLCLAGLPARYPLHPQGRQLFLPSPSFLTDPPALQSDIINVCIQENQKDVDDFGRPVPSNAITDGCNDDHNRSTFGLIAWLIVATLWAALSALLAASYLHQSLDPSSSRRHLAASDRFRMGPYHGSDPPFVPPPQYGVPQTGPYGRNSLPPYERGDADIKLAEDGKHPEDPFDNSSTVTLTAADANHAPSQQPGVYSDERRREEEARV